VWPVNVKDVEWLTVEFADDSEEISNIQHELDRLKQNSNTNENSRRENRWRSWKNYYNSNVNKGDSKFHWNNMKL